MTNESDETTLTHELIFDMLKEVSLLTNSAIRDNQVRSNVDRKLKQISMLVNVLHMRQEGSLE